MFASAAVAQPTTGANLDMIAAILGGGGIERVDIACAYATESGVAPLLNALSNGLGAAWATVPKRWVLAFDYCRTEPFAADHLAGAPESDVRIHDAAAVLQRKGTPRTPFHPKTFLFRGPDRHTLFTGSGNLSRSGMLRGHEVGVLLDHRGKPTEDSAANLASIVTTQSWFDGIWDNSTPYSDVSGRYKLLFSAQPNLKNPAPTEDDIADFELKRGGLSPDNLAQLRVCNHLWIDAGKVTRNRGSHLPGNQLMMKRMSRVFFGVPARDVPKNTALATLEITLNGALKPDCSLTFSDNKMDKLTLPVPAGPVPTYDHRTLVFTRLGRGRFQLDVGGAALKAASRGRSAKINAAFKMSGSKPREWGVY